jgi:hypothetical protein
MDCIVLGVDDVCVATDVPILINPSMAVVVGAAPNVAL